MGAIEKKRLQVNLFINNFSVSLVFFKNFFSLIYSYLFFAAFSSLCTDWQDIFLSSCDWHNEDKWWGTNVCKSRISGRGFKLYESQISDRVTRRHQRELKIKFGRMREDESFWNKKKESKFIAVTCGKVEVHISYLQQSAPQPVPRIW